MDNTTNPEVELDNTTTTETPAENKVFDEKDEIYSLKTKVAILERHLRKQSGNTVSKETLDQVEKLAQKQTIQEFAEENGISTVQAKELFSFKPDMRKEDLSSPFVKAALDGMKRQQRVQDNTPGSNHGSAVQEDFFKLSREERIKAFSKLTQG